MPAIVQAPITGAEAKREDGSAFDAIVDFYRAFNGAISSIPAFSRIPGLTNMM